MKVIHGVALCLCALLSSCGKTAKTSLSPVAVERTAAFSGEYFQLGDLDEGPVLLSKTEPVYPKEFFSAHIPGYCVVAFIVDATGTPTQVQFTKASDAAFVDPSVRAVKSWRFSPATKSGNPVACHLQVPLVFDGDWEENKVKEGESEPLIPMKREPNHTAEPTSPGRGGSS
jgi:TonB family protein